MLAALLILSTILSRQQSLIETGSRIRKNSPDIGDHHKAQSFVGSTRN